MRTALTGNIASGKSQVEKILIQKGYKVLDTDSCAHEILSSDDAIKSAFKNYDVFENSQISREKLGKLVFNDKKLLAELNSLIHPKIKEKILEFQKNNENGVVSIPLLFETGMENLFDKIVMVFSDDEIRLERLMKRNGYERVYAIQRINSQMPQQDKLSKCDAVIYNNGTLEDLKHQVDLIF